MTFSLDFFTAEVPVFRASVYRDCKSDDDLSCSQASNQARRQDSVTWGGAEINFGGARGVYFV